MPHKGFQEENTRLAQKNDLRRGPVFLMNLLPFMILSLLIFTRATEASPRLFVTINDEKEEKEKEAAGDTQHVIIQPTVHIYIKKDMPDLHAEASGNKNNEALKLHNSLESLREYLEEISMKKTEGPNSKTELPEALRDEFGPHYHTMNTEEPPLELPIEELQVNEVFEDRPKDLFFRPVPLSDKAEETQERVQRVMNEDQHVRETVLLGVSSATLAILLLLTICCAVSIYHCSKQYTYWDNLSLTSSEQRALFGPSYYQSDSSDAQREGVLLPALTPEAQTSSQMKLTRTLTFSATIHAVDEVSSFSDESTRTTEKIRSTEQSETEQSDVGALGAPKHVTVRPVSAPQPALAPPPSTPQGALAPPPPSAPGAAPPAAPSTGAPASAPPAPPPPSTPGTAPAAPPPSTPGTTPPAPPPSTPGTAPPGPPTTTPGTAPPAPPTTAPGTAPPAPPPTAPGTAPAAPPPTAPGTAPPAPPPTAPGTAPPAPPPTTPGTAPPAPPPTAPGTAPPPTAPGTAPPAPPPTTPGTAPAPPSGAPASSTPAPAPPPPAPPPPVGVPPPTEPKKPPPS